MIFFDSLKHHLVRLIIFGEAELGIKVLLEHGRLVDGLEELGVDVLLVLLALIRHDGRLPVGVKELLPLSLGNLGLGEVRIVNVLWDLNLANIDRRGRGDDVCLVHALKRNAVHLVGSGNQQKAAGKGLQANNPLTAEAAREEDEDSPLLDGASHLAGLLVGLAALLQHALLVRQIHARALAARGLLRNL